MAGLSPGLKSRLRPIFEFRRDLFRLFVPPLCAVCDGALGARETWVCRNCMTALAADARQMEREVELGGGKSLRVLYSLPYTPAVSRLIKDMKYSDRPGLSDVLAPFLALALSSMSLSQPLLVPVPLHAAKRRERGYNQSRLLSAGVSRLTGIDIAEGALLKVKNSSPQAGLDGARRADNMKKAFTAAGGEALAGRHVILVDDVVTTGATLAECAFALRDAGVLEVTGCAVASSA
jgi:ComF family protein